MIPIRDAVPAHTRPAVTLTLVATSAAVMILLSLMPAGFIGALVIAEGSGGNSTAASPEWLWTLLSLVRPTGWFQGVTCAVALWIFGPTVEDRVGHGRFVVLYVGCAATAALAVALVGAIAPTTVDLFPGAVGGVVGAHAALYPRARTLVLIPATRGIDVDTVPAVLLAAFWVVFQMASSIGAHELWPAWTPRLALLQLTVGIVAGAAAVIVLRRPERMRVEWWNR